MYKRTLSLLFVAISTMLASAPLALAAEEGAKGDPVILGVVMITAGVVLVVAVIAAVFGQSRSIVAALDGIARNPAASGKILTTMLVGLAMIESLAIYALVIALILILANPFI